MNSKFKILVCDGMDKDIFNQLRSIDSFEVFEKSKYSQEEIKTIITKAHAVIIRSATTCNEQLLALAPELKLIIRAGEGTDNIDKSYCKQRGIKVANTPGANNNSAAELAISLMFTVLRKTALANSTMHLGKWNKAEYTGLELTDKTIGIIGFGRIGQLVAKRLSGFDPKIIYYDPSSNNSSHQYKKANTLEELITQSDVITIHVPLTSQTENMITHRQLSLMKKNSIIINASRGKIINETDLYQALKENKIKGAGLDVFSTEPLPSDSSLMGLNNLVMTPHIGASTEEADLRVGQMVIDQLQQYFINNKLINEVTK